MQDSAESEIYAKLIAESLDCDFMTGVLRWKRRPLEHFPNQRACSTWNALRHGKIAGCPTKRGYWRVKFGRDFLAHRVVWLLAYGEWPDGSLDHIDHDKMNNSLGNLRCVTHQVNQMNKSLSQKNSSGVMGVRWEKDRQRWLARVKHSNRTINLGRYKTLEEAIEARSAALIKFGFHKNHGDPVFERSALYRKLHAN